MVVASEALSSLYLQLTHGKRHPFAHHVSVDQIDSGFVSRPTVRCFGDRSVHQLLHVGPINECFRVNLKVSAFRVAWYSFRMGFWFLVLCLILRFMVLRLI